MNDKKPELKARTLDTLRGMVEDLKIEALHSGRYPTPVDPDKWDQRDKSKAFQCIAYRQGVRRINALTDAIDVLDAIRAWNRREGER